MGKLENQKQEVEIMENVVRKKGLSLNAKIITALLVAIVLALSLLLSMVDTMNTTNIIKEKFVTFIDRLSYSEIVFLSMIAFISIVFCLVLIGVLKISKNTPLSDYKDYEYNQNFKKNDTGNSYPTDALNPLSFAQGLYKD
ncbi:hypothetical protein [Campylobacter sp. US33a]|uniref:hypothetical protein n=1 Tax=Campylobacter sp. US33a TaxID=2498120 RepID=UPI001067C0DA|nr:hypothetical protein [Campylobacter sp. US33a]TEY02331.1 hypothetical protein ELQ16_05485 [Campylobacter sp. US33a]